MNAVTQVSALLVVCGLTMLFGFGHVAYARDRYDILAAIITISATIVLFGGAQFFLIDPSKLKKRKEKSDGKDALSLSSSSPSSSSSISLSPAARSMDVGWRVCSIVSLIVFIVGCLFALCIIFFTWSVNMPYRVHFASPDLVSTNVREATLPNGLRYSIAHSNYKRDTFSIAMRIDVGHFDEEDFELGVSHLVQQLALKSVADPLLSHSSSFNPSSPKSLSGVHGMTELEAMGVAMKTSTSHRSTLYTVKDVPISESNSRNLAILLRALRRMALEQDVSDEDVKVARGVANAEERLRNGTEDMLRSQTLCNHFGPSSRTCRRLSFSPFERVEGFSATDVESFLSKWYHPSRIQLFVAGSFDVELAASEIESVWNTESRFKISPSPHSNFIPPNPSSPVHISTMPGLKGTHLTLFATTPYDGDTHTSNYHRKLILDRLFHILLQNNCLSHLSDLDMSVEEVKGAFSLFASVENVFDLDHTVHMIRLVLQDPSESGTWKRYLEVFFTELRRLATVGPHPHQLEAALNTARSVMEGKMLFSSYLETSSLVKDMLGSAEQGHIYLDPQQEYHIHSQYLNGGFTDAARVHIEEEAKFMWAALRSTVMDRSVNLTSPVYVDAVTTLTVTEGVTHRPSMSGVGTGGQGEGKGEGERARKKKESASSQQPSIGLEDLRRLIRSAELASLSSHEIPTVVDIAGILLKPYDSISPWAPHASLDETPNEVGEDSALHEHVSSKIESEEDEAEVTSEGVRVQEGLPRYGSLVDTTRLSPVSSIPKFLREESNRPPRRLSVSEHEYKERQSQYTLVETYASSGVKRYQLSNGLFVNLKQRLSGRDMLPCDAPGVVEIEVVSIGGRAVLPGELKGVCELLNQDTASSFSVRYFGEESSSDSNLEEVLFDAVQVKRYLKPVGRPLLLCEGERLVLRKRLHSKCVNFPHLSDCDPSSFDYMKKLEAVRIALSPVFDRSSIVWAAERFKRTVHELMRTSDPDAYLTRYTLPSLRRPWLSEHAPEVERERFEPVTAADIEKLDPKEVRVWLSEQLSVDRLELNVAGDFEEHSLLKQLCEMFATMPLTPLSSLSPSPVASTPTAVHPDHQVTAHAKRHGQVGLDIYNNADVDRFNLHLQDTRSRDTHAQYSACHLRTAHPGRVHVAVSFLTATGFAMNRGHFIDLVASTTLRQALLNRLRKEKGYISEIDCSLDSSWLFPRFGHFTLKYVIGLSAPGGSGRNEVAETLSAIEEVLGAEEAFSSLELEQAKAFLLTSWRSYLQDSSSWFDVLRGVSLEPPVWENHVFQTLKDLSETDVLLGIRSVSLSAVNEYFHTAMSRSHPVHVGVVETVTGTDEPIMAPTECEWIA